jgi:endonuclease YncB( thermonuclease family)
MLAAQLWTYRARAARVIDGDTLDVELDQGLHTYRLERLRLLGVNTPELHASDPAVRAQAAEAKAFVERWLEVHAHGSDAVTGWPLLLITSKSDAFGRWLADVYCAQDHSLTAELLAAGYPPWERKAP